MKNLQSIIMLISLTLLSGCTEEETKSKDSFLQIGEFAINRVSDELTVVRDGAGRNLALIPREAKIPEGFEPHMVVRVPVQSVVAYGGFDVAALRVLGVLNDTLVGVTKPKKKWFVDDVTSFIYLKIAVYDQTGRIFKEYKAVNKYLQFKQNESIFEIRDDLENIFYNKLFSSFD